MIEMTLAEVAEAVGGSVAGADATSRIDAVVTDSRAVTPGCLFVAIVGETHDGHGFVPAAVADGAVAALVSEPVTGPHILVPDTIAAVGRLARAVIDGCPDLEIVALTGSSGKTSTKDMLRVMLSAFDATVAPQGSFNNELGLPRTVFEVTGQTRYLVSEMGARGEGHIAYLCGITPPDVSLFLNVGHAHLSEFGSQEGIAQAKSEILSALSPEGVAVLNADDPRVMGQADKAPGRIVTFGQSVAADVRITSLALEDGKAVVDLSHAGDEVTVRLGVHGEHQGFNLACCLATAVALDLDFRAAAEALQDVRLDSRWRMEVTRTADDVTVINDAYNANPESMAAGLRALASMGRGHTTWAVLGEMRELGDAAIAEHDAVGRLCVRLNISRLIAVGDGAVGIHMGAAHEGSWGEESMWVPDVETAIEVLREQVRPGDYVLVKASRAIGLERVAAAVLGEFFMKLVVIAGLVALLVTLLGTRLLIRLLMRYGYSQAIRVSTEGIPYPEHEGKRGTPSMGGLAILIALVTGYTVSHLYAWQAPSASGLLALYLIVGLGLVGAADDYLKIFRQRATGIRARTKLFGQGFIALSFAYGTTLFPDEYGRTPASNAVSLVRDTPIVLPLGLLLLWIWLLITASTNAVNLSDGLDGLAAGASAITFMAYTLLGVWQYGQNCSFGRFMRCYDVRDPLDLAVVAAAMAGACVGFLWWNCSPAQIFMGDTGSLALGGGIAALAILTRTELLLPLMGGLFLIITLSVIGQVGSFKLTGKRMFRMAPLHHHFEMKGWGEVTIVVRFWIVQALFVAAALSLFYAEWVRL